MTCRYRHKNLVELMGVCKSPPALVLEFMEEGSLYDHIHKVSHSNTMYCIHDYNYIIIIAEKNITDMGIKK